MTEKQRVTISFDQDVLNKVLIMRGNPEHSRKSISRLVNELLEKELEKRMEENKPA